MDVEVQIRLCVIEEVSCEYRRPQISKRVSQLLIGITHFGGLLTMSGARSC